MGRRPGRAGVPGSGGEPGAGGAKRPGCHAVPTGMAYQAPPSMGFSRQEYWSGLPFPSPGDLPNSGIEPGSPTLQADVLTSEPPGIPCVPKENIYQRLCPEVTKWRSPGKPRGVRVPKKGELIAHKQQK